MTDASFLAAILDDPDDTALRLIYADWLEERGDPRGEFIRLQCEPDRLGRPALAVRERQLLEQHGRDWAGPLALVAEELEFRRGFVEKITVTPRTFLAHAAELLALAPLRHVHFYRRNDISIHEVMDLVQSPFLGRLATVQLSSDRGIRDDAAGVLAAAPRLAHLACLDLSNNWIKNAGARLLADSPHLARLPQVRLARNPIGKEGRAALRQRFGDRVIL